MWKSYKFIICVFCVVMFGDGSFSGHINVKTYDDDNANNDEEPYVANRRLDKYDESVGDKFTRDEIISEEETEEEMNDANDEDEEKGHQSNMDGMYHVGLEQNYDSIKGKSTPKMDVNDPGMGSEMGDSQEDYVNALKKLNMNKEDGYGYDPNTNNNDENDIENRHYDRNEVSEKELLRMILEAVNDRQDHGAKKMSRSIDGNEMTELNLLTRFFEKEMQEKK